MTWTLRRILLPIRRQYWGDSDPALIHHALGVVARVKGMTEIAQRTGFGRQILQARSADGHPEFATVLNVARAWAEADRYLRFGIGWIARAHIVRAAVSGSLKRGP
jgi:probable addiction module antidote protein